MRREDFPTDESPTMTYFRILGIPIRVGGGEGRAMRKRGGESRAAEGGLEDLLIPTGSWYQ